MCLSIFVIQIYKCLSICVMLPTYFKKRLVSNGSTNAFWYYIAVTLIACWTYSELYDRREEPSNERCGVDDLHTVCKDGDSPRGCKMHGGPDQRPPPSMLDEKS